jgi:hypothetical protein
VRMRRDAAERHAGYRPKPDENMDWTDWVTPWGRLDNELRPAELTARKALREQVANELQ